MSDKIDGKIDGKIQGELKLYRDLTDQNDPVLMGFKGHSILERVSNYHVEELKKKVADPRCDPEKDLNDVEKQILQDLLDKKDPRREGYFYAPYSLLRSTPTVLETEELEDRSTSGKTRDSNPCEPGSIPGGPAS